MYPLRSQRVLLSYFIFEQLVRIRCLSKDFLQVDELCPFKTCPCSFSRFLILFISFSFCCGLLNWGIRLLGRKSLLA